MSVHQVQSAEEKTTADQLEELKKTTTIDTLHKDEGVRVLASYEGDKEWTKEEEKKLTRKIDRRLLSILCCTYGLQYYDKAMLSQAVSVLLVLSKLTAKTDIYAGAVRPTHRSRARDRQPL